VVTVKTYYRDLEIPRIENQPPPVKDHKVSAELKVDIKKFLKFLYSAHINPNNVICCLVEDHAVILHVLLDDMFMTYFISTCQ